jgi:hypothetical protein
MEFNFKITYLLFLILNDLEACATWNGACLCCSCKCPSYECFRAG